MKIRIIRKKNLYFTLGPIVANVFSYPQDIKYKIEWKEKMRQRFDIFCYHLFYISSIEAHLGHIFWNNQVVFTKDINSIISRKLSKVVLLMFFFSRNDFSTSRCKILQSFVIIDFFILRQKNKSNLINASMIYCGMVTL